MAFVPRRDTLWFHCRAIRISWDWHYVARRGWSRSRVRSPVLCNIHISPTSYLCVVDSEASTMATALSPPPRASPAVQYRPGLNGAISRSPSSSVSPRRKAVPNFDGELATFSRSHSGEDAKSGLKRSPLQQGDVFLTAYTTPSGLMTPPNGEASAKVERSLPPTPNESPAIIYGKDNRNPSALNLGAPLGVNRHNSGSSSQSGQAKAGIPQTNQGVHYLRAARQKGSTVSLPSHGSSTDGGPLALGNIAATGLAERSAGAGPAAPCTPPATPLASAIGASTSPYISDSTPLGYDAPVGPALPSKKAPVTGLFNSTLVKPKDDGFSVEALPSAMGLWEASHCRITDELGRSRRFGDFWDDIEARPDAEASSVLARGAEIRRADEERSEKESRRASVASRKSTTSQASRASTADMTETSDFQSERGAHTPSLGSLELTLDATGPSARVAGPGGSVEAAPSSTPPLIGARSDSISSRHSNGSTHTLRKPLSRKRTSASNAPVQAGGEEWIVMGRRTVVFFIRNFWCGQCQYRLLGLRLHC